MTLVIVTVADSLALDPSRRVDQYRLRSWETKDGLPVNSVHALGQDADGYLWLGTESGLARFDGVRMELFSPAQVEAMPSGLIEAIAVSDNGTLWIGTAGGLVAYDGGMFVEIDDGKLPNGEAIQCLAEDGATGVWVGTSFGLLRVREIAGPVEAVEALDGASVRALTMGRDGELWIGTQDGLMEQRSGRVVSVAVGDEGLGAPVHALYEDRSGVLWVATNGNGLFALSDEETRHWDEAAGMPSDNVFVVTGDRDGNIWVGTNGGGLVRLTGEVIEVLSSDAGLSGDLIRSLLEDHQGNLWVGTMGGGLSQLVETPLITWTTHEGLASDLVLPILETSDGSIWCGGDRGLSRVRDKMVERYGRDDGVPHNVVLSLAQTPDGRVWAGTAGGGLAVFEDNRFRVAADAAVLGTDLVTALLVRADGSLVVGTHHGGLFVRSDEQFERLGPDGWLSSEGVFVLAEDSERTLWVGGQRSGVFRLDEERGPQRMADDVVDAAVPPLSMLEIEPGRMLIGTGGAGLVLVGPEGVRTASSVDGLPDDVIMNLQDDRLGWVWAGTHSGVFRVAREELLQLFAGEGDGVNAELFTISDGMTDLECNAGFHPAGARTDDGQLWFPTAGGAVTVDPAELDRERESPQVLIEDFQYASEELAALPSVKLPVGERSLQIRYTAFDYYAPEQLQFEYRLIGFDDEWVRAGERRVAFYTNLPPGEYRFAVRAQNAKGALSRDDASMVVRIPGRFTESIVFYVLCVAAAAGVGFAVARQRIAQLQKRQDELESLMREREAAELALRESEERLRDLFENANDLIFTLDLDGRISACNREAERAVGVAAGVLHGRLFPDLVAEHHRSVAVELLRQTFENGSSEQGRLELQQPGSRGTVIELKTRPLVIDDAVVGLQGIGRDIGEREQLELELRQAQKMEAVGRLAGGVAHDFNNVLAVIMGRCELLMMRRPDEEMLRSRLQEILDAGARAADLVRQLLAFSRREVGVPKPLELNEVVRETGRMVKQLLAEDINLEMQLDEEPLWVFIDRAQLEQIVMNLTINARDAMPAGGRLTIRTGRGVMTSGEARRETEAGPERCATLEIEDTGSGMDAATVEQIFEPFFTTKEPGKGTGLGLATVYGVVRRAGGTISVRSEPGQGTCFSVGLPRVAAPGDAGEKTETVQEVPVFGGVVLVVDDAESVRASVVEMVRALGGVALEADGLESARRVACDRRNIDVLLTDVVMPGGRGDTVAAEISSLRPEVRVVFMSGHAGDRVDLLQREHGFLQKPFTVAELAAALRSAPPWTSGS